jgi:hypothetical protein
LHLSETDYEQIYGYLEPLAQEKDLSTLFAKVSKCFEEHKQKSKKQRIKELLKILTKGDILLFLKKITALENVMDFLLDFILDKELKRAFKR